MPRRGMSFGVFLAPFHAIGENPTLSMERDMELIERLDQLATMKLGSASTIRLGGRPSPALRFSLVPPSSGPGISSWGLV